METHSQSPRVADVEGAIRNPANPDHFMVVQLVESRVQINIDGNLVADTSKAVRVIEIGNKVYEPRLYIPASDVLVELTRTDRSTPCPLKGDAAYFTYDGVEICWSYDTFDFAKSLDGYHSFFAPSLQITEGR